MGKKADIVVVDINNWHSQPKDAASVYAHLVYQAYATDVCQTIVDGKLVMTKGEMLTIDELQVKAKASESLKRVRERVGLL